jgi:hypothetical protein
VFSCDAANTRIIPHSRKKDRKCGTLPPTPTHPLSHPSTSGMKHNEDVKRNSDFRIQETRLSRLNEPPEIRP